jgi:hypothetical protein
MRRPMKDNIEITLLHDGVVVTVRGLDRREAEYMYSKLSLQCNSGSLQLGSMTIDVGRKTGQWDHRDIREHLRPDWKFQAILSLILGFGIALGAWLLTATRAPNTETPKPSEVHTLTQKELDYYTSHSTPPPPP